MKPSISWNNNMLKSNTTLNENTQSGSIPEDFKIEAPKLYEAPDYTIQEYPAPTNPYERKGFGFDPSGANKEDFIKYVYASKLIRERGGDEMLRRGGVMNALYCINKNYRFMPAKYAYEEFFGGDIPIDQAEAELDRLYDIAANSEDALGKFLKLDDAKQEEIIRQNIPGGKKKKAYTAIGSSGGAILVDVNNPNFDYQKGREEYLEILRAKNIWEGYLRIRNAFSPDVVRDAMRFKTATDSRSNAAEAVLIKMREKGPEYRTAFLASLDALGVNIIDASDHNILRRAFTRISEGWTDSGVNMADSFYYSKSNARVLYGIAEEMGLVDKNGNLTEDASKLDKLRQAYESSQNADANRALGSAGGWTSRSSYKNSDVKKLFEEGKENIETRRLYRNLRANLATQYNYSGEEWKTLEDMLVYGEYTLRAIGVGTATLAATKNPLLASFASVPMMFAEETARMYSELRLDAGLSESQASLLAMQYGVAVSAAEQLQLGRFMGSFVGKSAAKSFKEYVFNNFKGGVKKAIKESALETGVELSQNTYDLATKIFAAEAFGAGFNTDQLLDNYIQDFKSAALITPLITTFIFGVGAPFRFSGTLSNVGANYGTAAKAIVGIKPSEVVENNVKTVESMRAAGEYEALVKDKYGATEQGRDFLFKYLNAKDSVERNSILHERFPDSKERSEAKLLLENFKRLDNDALKSILRVKLEAAQKREAEAQSILKGDTTDISALDAETTDEAGNGSYEILDSAIDALGMRDEVIFVNNAKELAQASGMTLNAAENVISRKGAKGFFDEKNGKIVIIKSHFASGADALQSFAHEYGHKIMANIRKNDINGYKRMCLDVLELIGGEGVARVSLPASYSQVGHANYAKDSLDVAEESLMRILEQVALKKVLDTRKKSVWARFKGWFQKLFSEKSLADITNERLAQIALDVLQKEKSFNVSVPNTPSKNWRAKTPEADGVSVSGEWEVVDAGDLKTSLDAGYDDALQPRNRSRQSSKEQVLNIANNLDPELLDNDPRTSDGAPIVDSRSMAVSGNGRILAIRQAYESGKAEEYRKHVLSRANSMGIDVPAGIKNPVLIRRVKDTGNMSIEELAARSNKSSVAGMSVAEQAVADGRRISEAGLLDIFFPGADGNILAESNRDFNNAFLNLVGGSETFRNKDGSLRTNLSPRVRAAVLAAMLNSGGNRDIVERLLDNPEGYNALINGLMQCAANLAELSQKPQYDISGELSQAVELYIEMHDKGQTVAEFEAQPDMFREQPSAEVMFLCRLFEANQKSSSGISGVLKEYAAQCKKIDTTTVDLFGEEDPSKLDKLQAAYDHYATDLAQGMDNLRALDRGNSAYANFDERKLNDKETLKNLTPEEILERIKSVKSVSFPVERLDENFNLKYYWNWFEKNLLDREIPTAIRRNAVFKKGHFFKLIASGKNKGFIKGYTTPEDAFKAIKKGKVLLHDKDLAPEGFSMARARQMPLVLDVLQDPFFVLKDKKTKDFIFLKKYEGGNDWMAVMFNDTDMGIISWHQKNITRAFAEKNTIVKQKNGVDFLAQPRESSKRDESLKTLSESENNSENQENSSKKWREVSEPIKQKFSSGNTSLRQIAAGFKKIDFKPGTTNFDLGGGKFDEGTKYLETKGVKNFVFDPVNRDSKTNKEAFEIVKNGGFDTTTCNNVLNVISEANVRDNIILQAAKSLRPNGTAYFTVYEGDGSGKGRQSQKDSWQEHRKTVDYLGEIKKHFGDVSLKNKVITARKPILLNEKASWFMDDSFENPVRWKDDADISDISAKVKKIIDSISDKKNKHIEVLRKISDTEADFLLKKTGLDLKGYSHSIDNYSILHILKKHGSEKELQRGQIPVTIKDIQNFPTIVSDYDDVKYAGKSKIGRDTIRFEKNIGDNLVLVFEEMRIGKKLLALSTMYIQKRKKLTSNANASSNTSETLSTSSDFQESANTPENQENNSRLKALLRQERSENPDIRWREVSETKRAADEWANNSENVRKLTEEYLAEQKGQIVVDPDRIRAKLPNYEVSLNSDFVEAGDNVLEEVWKEALKRAPKDKPVVLLTGNPAAGKGTAIKLGHLNEVSNADLVFDAPQNKFTSVEKRVKEAVYAGHRVFIIQIYNDPITSWRNSLKRGIGKDNPKTGKREGGRFLPLEYFVRVYESAQGKVEKIENILKQNYKDKLETKYIDNTGNNPIVVSPDEALAWDYSISDDQLKEIEGITDEYRGRIEESARLRGDKKDPLAVIRGGVSQVGLDSFRVSSKGISRRTESGDERDLSKSNSGGETRLKALLRQERSENPVIWASIVLAREILLGRAITNAKIDKVLPPDKFDGTKRQYALDRAKHIAEHCKATQENYANRLDEAVKLAEIDVYWKHDVMEEMYRSYRKDGEEYGIAKQRLLDWIKSEQRKDLENVKGLSSDELGIDVPAAIENALQEEPARKKKEDDSKNEPQDEELESFAEDGIDDEILGSKEKLAPSSLREIIDKIRIAVTKKIKALGGDEQTRRRLYRNTLAEVLKESANNLTFGREREAIMKKIAELSQKGYAVIKIKEGERTGQKIDNYTLRAEHIALRIFNRGVRDTKRELSEKFEKIVSRKGKKPSRMERDDKRALAGAVQMRVYNIKRYSEMDAAELEAEYSATVDRLENVEKNFAEDAGKGEVRSDIEDIRAEVANAVHDMKMFGNWRDKSRAQMAEGVEFLEKYIDEETEEQKARVEARKEENARRRNVFIAALRQSKRNANKDGELRKLFRGIVNNTLPFDSILSILGEAATGKTYAEFKILLDEIVSKVNRAAENVSNECFAKKEKLYAILRECYGKDQSTALRRLLKADAKYERFSKNPETPNPMTLANVMQLYATALQTNYQRNIFEHRIRKSEEEIIKYKKVQKIIDSIRLNDIDNYSKGMLKQSREALERERDAIIANSVSDYISELEGVLTEADKKFVAALRAEYAEALPALSAVSRRVIGLPIEQADELYMPVKVDYGGGLGEGTGGVPVVPKSLSPRVSHLRDFDETADPITLYLERVKENAQFKYFSELYIELRGIFADESLQKLIRERCGADVLKLLKESIADICTGETKGFNLKAARQASGLFAIAQLGWNFGSGVRQFLPGVFSWGAYIGTPAVLKNCVSFFTPEGFRAALEIAHSETGRRRFAVGNMQIIEEMLEKPDQSRFWRLYKRYALVFNRSSDMLAIMFVGQGVYRTGVENYLRKGFTETEAKKRAMSDMWQIAERSQASGKIHNMSAWQRRGGDLAKAIGMFSSPPQLMFAKATQDMRRAIALGIKTPEGRAAAWNAVKTLFTVSVLVEGSYAASTVLWNALLKGYFDDDDDEYILKSMITGPFGGLFLFGRLVDSLGTGYSPSAIPMEGLARPAQYTIELVKDIAVFDWDEAIKDLDKLASSAFSPWRDLRKILKDKKK